jgi:DNA-binding NarL/FixJ family response regulator
VKFWHKQLFSLNHFMHRPISLGVVRIVTIRVAILEDDTPTREFLQDLFVREDGFELVFAADCVGDAQNAMLEQKIDVALIDIRLPDGNGLEFIAPFVAETGGKALILTVLGDRASVLLAFEFGASGYLLKDTHPEQIIRDIRALIEGGSPISPQAAAHLLSLVTPGGSKPGSQPENILTTRECDVLAMFAKGLSYREAAGTLGISVHTIGDHVKSIYGKMEVRSRSEAVFEAVQNGWLDL